VAGVTGTVINTPFDVVKTRVQNSHGPAGWTFKELSLIARNEGIVGLYKGFVPKVLRLGPGGGILYVVYNKVCDLLR
jgi:solute carrier family 25 2-oxodicarboxylate transporter 21